MTGETFSNLNKNEKIQKHDRDLSQTFSDILERTKVFARTTPTQKSDIVKRLKQIKELKQTLVAYCGDGANDTLALKESDIGLSLSRDEASLAAPFRTTKPELSTIVCLLLEGRAALNLNFVCFKYFLFYSYA